MAVSDKQERRADDQSQEIALLGQALQQQQEQIKQLNDLNNEQQKTINLHSENIHQAHGQMGLLRVVMPLVFVVLISMTSGLGWSGITENSLATHMLEIALTKIDEKLKAQTDKLDKHHTDNDESLRRQSGSIGSVKRDVDNLLKNIHTLEVYDQDVKTQIAGVIGDMSSEKELIDEMTRSVVELRSMVNRVSLGVDEHEEELDTVEEKVANMQADSAKIRAAAQANFAEIETQLRSLVDVENLTRQQTHHLLQMLWSKAFPDVDLPEMDFYPDNIPAKAMSTVGSMNGS